MYEYEELSFTHISEWQKRSIDTCITVIKGELNAKTNLFLFESIDIVD